MKLHQLDLNLLLAFDALMTERNVTRAANCARCAGEGGTAPAARQAPAPAARAAPVPPAMTMPLRPSLMASLIFMSKSSWLTAILPWYSAV